MMARHTQAVPRQEWLLSYERSAEFGAERERKQWRDGKSHPGRTAADDRRDRGEHVPEIDVLAAQNVSFPDLAAPQCCQVPRRHVVDVYEIEAGVYESRHTAGRRLNDDAAGGRWLHVAWADRCRGIDDHGRERVMRSEERRVGKGGRWWGSRYV